MSIASSQLAMGYVAFTHSTDRCSACDHGQESQAPDRGLRCTLGAFYVRPTGTCRRFRTSSSEHAGTRVQIGPTDI